MAETKNKQEISKYEELSAGEIHKILGRTGLKNLSGRIQEEYHQQLKSWQKRCENYREMQDDIVIGTALDAIKLPLLATDLGVEAAGETPADELAAEFLRLNMEQMFQQSWRNHITDCLYALDYGFSISEIVLEKRDDGRLWIRNLDPRGQETLEKWEFDEYDKVDVFVQRDPDTGKEYKIPIDKCIHVTFRGRKGNPEGRSLLRWLWRPWRFLKNLENLEAIGAERDAGGMPVLDLPAEGVSSEDMVKIKKALAAIRIDEALYFINPYGGKLAPYAGGTKMYDIGAIIARYQKLILMRVFAQFLMLGMGSVGTQSLVKGSQDFFSIGLRAVQEEILEAWNQQLVPFLFRYNNFSGLSGLPQITWSPAGKADIKSFLEAYSIGVKNKAITPIREDEISIRALMDLADLPEGEGEGTRDIEQPAITELWDNQAKTDGLEARLAAIENAKGEKNDQE